MSRRSLRLLVVAAAAFGCMAAPAAAGAAGLYVSGSSPVVAGGKSCAQPNYNKIQDAINANNGNTINVCPGTYTEQLTIQRGVKLTAISGVHTATVAMPAVPARSTTSCDYSGSAEQFDELTICTGATVTITGLNVEAIVPLERCLEKLDAIFVGDGGMLKATSVAINGASTSVSGFKGCQDGIAALIGSAPETPSVERPAEVGHAILKNVSAAGYQKNGPTVVGTGSTLAMSSSTVTGIGPSTETAQNGVEVAYGAKGAIKSSTVSANECNLATACFPNGGEEAQASGVLFYQAATGSSLKASTVKENDMGVYYASGSKTVPEAPDVTLVNDVLNGNRYEGVLLEEGKAALKNDTIDGSGRVGIDLFQASYQEAPSESTSTGTKITGQTEAAIKVESDKAPTDEPGVFVFSKGTATGNATVLINESTNFEVIF